MRHLIPAGIALLLLIAALLSTVLTAQRPDDRITETVRHGDMQPTNVSLPAPPSNSRTTTDHVKPASRPESPSNSRRPKPVVRRESKEPPERAIGHFKSLDWLALHQNGDGSFGEGPIVIEGYSIDKTGITALALLPYLGAGYYHGSKDELGGRVAGEIVKNGLKWLIDRQNADGAFVPNSEKDSLINNALAGLALNEAYGLSGSDLFKEPSKRITDYLIRSRHQEYLPENNGWGREPTAVDNDTMATALVVESLFSAKLGTGSPDEKASVEIERALSAAEQYVGQAIKISTDPRLAFSSIILNRDRDDIFLEYAVKVMSQTEADFEQAPLSLYLTTFGMFQYDGPSGEGWKKWSPDRVKSLIPLQSGDGAWGNEESTDHRIVHTSLAALMLEVYYRYASVPGGSAPLK